MKQLSTFCHICVTMLALFMLTDIHTASAGGKFAASLTADRLEIQEGESATLTWTSNSATSVSLDNNIGEVALNSSIEVLPTATTTYTLVAVNGSKLLNDSVTITVIPLGVSVTMSALPLQIDSGQTSTLNWTSYNSTTASMDNGIGQVPTSGSIEVSPTAVSTTYTITVSGLDGNATASASIGVNQPPSTPVNIYSTYAADQINIHWSINDTQNSDLEYRVYKRVANSPFDGTFFTTSTNSYNDPDVLENTLYCYKVTAASTTKELESLMSTETCNMLNWGAAPEELESFSASADPGMNTATGDFNGDGITDLAVGFPNFSKGSIKGKVDLFLGGGVARKPVTLTGETDCGIGYSLAVADLNNDGYDDLASGNPDCSVEVTSGSLLGTASKAGKFFVYEGGPVLNNSPVLVLEGSFVYSWNYDSYFYLSERMGETLASLGDINGDGYNDIAISSPNGGRGRSGKVTVLLGGSTITKRTTYIQGRAAEDYLGTSLARAGDVNGDGYNDILVGAKDTDNDEIAKLYVIFGGDSLQLPAEIVHQINSNEDTSIAGLDYNGDGLSDLISNGAVYFGPVPAAPADITIFEGSTKMYPLGDGNNDGADDLLANNSIYLGMGGGPIATGLSSVIGSGDWNGDGIADLVADGSRKNKISVYSIASFMNLPSIELTSPENGSISNFREITISGTISGDIAALSIAGSNAVLQADGSFSHTVSLVDGINYFEILAESVNNTLAKKLISVEYQPPPPLTASFSQPLDGQEKYHTPISVLGTVNDPEATVTVNDTATTVEQGIFQLELELSEGLNTLILEARDLNGQSVSQSINVTLVTNGAVTGVITDSISGSPLEGVTITVTDSSASYTAISDEAGAYTINNTVQGDFNIFCEKTGYLSTTDSGFVAAGSSITMDAQLSPPLELAITSPADSTLINSMPVTVNLTTNTPYATITVNGTTATQTGETTFEATIDLPEGPASITATADDGLGQLLSTTINVIYAPPVSLTIDSPIENQILNSSPALVSGTVSSNATGVTVNGIPATINGDQYQATVPLNQGSNTLTAAASDLFGQQQSATVTVSYYAAPQANLNADQTEIMPGESVTLSSDILTWGVFLCLTTHP